MNAKGRPAEHRRTPRTLSQFEAFVGVLQAAEALQRGVAELLKEVDLSLPQYNVLRILRGAGPEGLACGKVGAKLIRHDPDVTRLLDRLERAGLVVRTREKADRRIVRTRITQKGLAALAQVDEPIDALHEQQLGHMKEGDLDQLTALLKEARARLP